MHSRARNKSDLMGFGLDDGYNVSNLLPIKGGVSNSTSGSSNKRDMLH